MEIRHANPDDFDLILDILDRARTIMRETGNATQWTSGYPSQDVISGDIGSGAGFVCIHNDKIVGYFCFMQGREVDPNYRLIEGGQWLNDKPYGVIHRLASARKVKGIAQAAFDFAFSRIANIRVDTHRENVPMQNYLKKNGFEYCGIIYVADGTPRDAFQKDLMPVR